MQLFPTAFINGQVKWVGVSGSGRCIRFSLGRGNFDQVCLFLVKWMTWMDLVTSEAGHQPMDDERAGPGLFLPKLRRFRHRRILEMTPVTAPHPNDCPNLDAHPPTGRRRSISARNRRSGPHSIKFVHPALIKKTVLMNLDGRFQSGWASVDVRRKYSFH